MQRSLSARSRKQGSKFFNCYQMQPEFYSAAVKLFSGEAQVMVTFNDLSLVSVLYESVSIILHVCRHSFSLVYEKRLIPRQRGEGYVEIPQSMDFFRFKRCPNVDLVFKMPPECDICTMQCRESGEEYWEFGTRINIKGFLIPNPRYTRTCEECYHIDAIERAWRGIRFWTYIVKQMSCPKARMKLMSAFSQLLATSG